MRKYMISLAGLFAFAWAAQAGAAVHATRCNSCSAGQYYTTAENWARSHNLATGNAYVYDLTFSKFKKYSISREPAGGAGQWTYYLEDTALTASESSNWTLAKDALASNGGRSNFFGHIDARTNSRVPDRQATVYDVLLMGAYQNDLSDWLIYNGQSNVVINDLGMTTVQLAQVALAIVLDSDLFTFTVSLTTTDGGVIDFHWETGFNHTTSTRALDANGNSIPLVNGQVVGRYRLGPNREPLFRDYLRGKFGGDITFGNTVCNNGVFACVTVSGPGGGYSCDWISCGGVN
jgi:hypothetical protein